MATPSIPGCPQDVTPLWLTSVLGVEVDDAAITPVGTGQTAATYR
ncbi:MAG: aminoglycoside phosphotransferase, partial [Mycobacteriaceae bacterium]|nr:aminoglycoside phosphotransferase [Mycobacteriaceae bacterium]